MNAATFASETTWKGRNQEVHLWYIICVSSFVEGKTIGWSTILCKIEYLTYIKQPKLVSLLLTCASNNIPTPNIAALICTREMYNRTIYGASKIREYCSNSFDSRNVYPSSSKSRSQQKYFSIPFGWVTYNIIGKVTTKISCTTSMKSSLTNLHVLYQ